MPYINQEKRDAFWKDSALSYLVQDIADCGGDLNYMFTMIVKEYIHKKGLSYATLNEIVGALECAKLELYRKVISKYEDKKCEENGEVY